MPGARMQSAAAAAAPGRATVAAAWPEFVAAVARPRVVAVAAVAPESGAGFNKLRKFHEKQLPRKSKYTYRVIHTIRYRG